MQTASNHSPIDPAHLAYNQGRFADALALVEPLLSGAVAFEANYLRGVILYRLQRFDEAIDSLTVAQNLQGGNATLRNTLVAALTEGGGVCLEQNEFTAALPYFEKALHYRHDYLPALLNYGFALQELGQFTSALDAYRAAIKTMNVDIEHVSTYDLKRGDSTLKTAVKTLYNIAKIQLTLGNFAEGWRYYGARPSLLALPFTPYQHILPQDLAGRRVLVVRDQGLGDEIFFLRYWPILQRRGAMAQYQPHAKLYDLLRQCSDIPLVAPDEKPATADYDFVVAAGDLPTVLQQVMPMNSPLPLRPCVAYNDELRAALAAAGPPPYIGVTWRAGSLAPDNTIATRIRKAVPLDVMINRFASYRGTLCVLQRQPQAAEIETLRQQLPSCNIADFSALNDDLPRMLSLLDLLNDYVGVSNTNMHLRGSLHKRASVLIPFPPEWRWQAVGEKSAWYPLFRMVRQNADLTWPAITEY